MTSDRATGGGAPARRAVLRWSLRMVRREWRQQILICVLVAVAVATTILAAGIISGGQVPQNAGYGTANQLARLQGQDPNLNEELAALRAHFGALGVIDTVPVSTGTLRGALLESYDPHAPYVASLLQLSAGRFPRGAHEVDLSSELAQLYGVRVGGTWVAVGQHWHVVGEVRDPTELTRAVALSAPGSIPHPATVTALFDSSPTQMAGFSPPKVVYSTLVGAISPLPTQSGINVGEFLVLVAATFGMLFIGLIAVAGFTVMARRRTRAIGMLGALGAQESNVRLALLVNGFVVGVVAMVLGGVVGLAAWFAYAPTQQSSVGHIVDPAAIPWWLVGVALVLAPLTTTIAARRPARVISRLPIVTALSGRPTEPRASRRNAAVGAGVLGGGLVVVYAGGSAAHGGGGGGVFTVLIGIVASCIGLFLLSQWIVGQLGRIARRAPVSARVALRDLARYRSRSGAALGAICLALLVTGVVVVAATARYSDPFDWVGPNLASNVVVVYPPLSYVGNGPVPANLQCTPGQGCKSSPTGHAKEMTYAQFASAARQVAGAIGATSTVALEQADASLTRTTPGRQFSGTVYVATPALLSHYGIAPSSISPTALVLTSRSTLPGAGGLALVSNVNTNGGNTGPCPPGYCVLNPSTQEVPQLPTGTSAPNTVLTMHAVRMLHLSLAVQAYELTTPVAITTLQKQQARTIATETNTNVETANSFASLDEVLAWSIGAGLLLALGVLAMTVGLIRAETASELRVLTAAGASRRTRRALTSVTAAALGFVGAVLGVATAYLLVTAFLMSNVTNNIYELATNIPVRPLAIMVFGLPVLAGIGGWLFAGREPSAIAHQPID